MADDDKDDTEAKDSAEDSTDESEDKTDSGRDPDQPMNKSQKMYLEPLAESQESEMKDDMSEADAASKIDTLQEQAVSVY